MAKIPKVLQEHINTAFPANVCLVGSVLPNGFAQITPRGGTMVYDDQHIALWERGKGSTSANLTDGTRLTAGKDEFVLLPPFVPVLASETEAPSSFWYCHFNFRVVPGHFGTQIRENLSGPGDKVPLPLHFSRAQAPGVAQEQDDGHDNVAHGKGREAALKHDHGNQRRGGSCHRAKRLHGGT